MKFTLLSLPDFSPEINSAVDSVKNDTLKVMPNINVQDVVSAFVKSMPPEIIQKLNLLLTIGIYVMVATFVYIIIKIIRQIIGMKDSKNIRIIAENTKEINSKIEKKK